VSSTRGVALADGGLQPRELALQDLHAHGERPDDLVEGIDGALGERRADLQFLHARFDRPEVRIADHGRHTTACAGDRNRPEFEKSTPLQHKSAMPRSLPRRVLAPFCLGLAALTFPSIGCKNFFEELGSDDEGDSGDDDDDDSDAGESGDTQCSFPEDDRCIDQDRLAHCDPETEESVEFDCSLLCGSNLNFSCITIGSGQHGCWCVETGSTKLDACPALEVCLRDCAAAPDDSCNEACFERTDAATARLYGTLVSCAHTQCHELCIAAPESCAACIATGIEGGGECGLARAVCDADENGDPLEEWD